MTKVFSLSLSALLAAGLGTQLSAQGGTINAGNVDYTFTNIPDSTTSLDGDAAFTAQRRARPTSLFAHWWYYRVASDPSEVPFNNGDTDGDGTNTQGFNEFYNNNQAILSWTDVDERSQMSAVWKMTLYSKGSSNGMAVSQMTVTNTSGAPIVLNTYTYADFDVCTNANLAVGQDGNSRHRITEPGCNITCEFLGIGMDHYEVAAWQGLQMRLVDGMVDILNDTGLPWPQGDYTGAFQWQDRQILPGQTATYTAILTFRDHPCNTPAASDTFGLGSQGSNGVPTLTTINPPIIGIAEPQGFDVLPKMRIGSGRPNAPTTLIAGLSRTNTPFANVTLYTNSIADLPLILDANGIADITLPIPKINALCGAKVVFQALILEPGSTPFPVAHSAGHEWTLGGFVIH